MIPALFRRGLPAALATFAFVLASDATAISRTFVASFGSDTNPCSLALPCRGFTVALAATDPGGEIVVLDSAGYGAVTIGKSVSIIVPAGIYAGISVLAGDGITINAAGIHVALTNLTINGQGGRDGVRFVQGARLNVVGCQITGMDRNGVRVEGAGTVVLERSAIRGSAQEGVFVGAAANVTIVRSRIQASGSNGIEMTGGAVGTVARTLSIDNGIYGIAASQAVAGTTRIAVDASVISDNDGGAGVYAEATAASAVAHIDVADSLVTRNFNGVYATSLGGGTTLMSATGNDIVENAQVGVTTVAGSGSTTRFRTSQNAVFRNPVAGLLQSSGSLYTNKNYVRDNDGGDSFGAQPDSTL